MKRVLIIASVAFALIACSSEPSAQLSGCLSDADVFSYGFQSDNDTGIQILDTYDGIENGKFAFDICNEPGELFLISKNQPATFIQLYLAKDEKIVMEGKVSDFKISGTPFYKDMGEYHELTKELDQKVLEAVLEMDSAAKEGREPSIDYARVKQSTDEDKDQISLSFIKSHPDSDFSVYLVSNIRKSLFERAESLLTDKAKNGKLKYLLDKAELRNMGDDVAKRTRAEAEGKVYVGSTAPDFTLKTLDGSDFTLSSLRGRYVMLDFWGAWCHWCVEGMPKVAEIAEKYADKLSVVSVDCNDSEAEWRKGVEDSGIMTWTQVYNPRTVAVDAQFLVEAFPTFVIIDPQGVIKKILVGESRDFVEEVGACLE